MLRTHLAFIFSNLASASWPPVLLYNRAWESARDGGTGLSFGRTWPQFATWPPTREVEVMTLASNVALVLPSSGETGG